MAAPLGKTAAPRAGAAPPAKPATAPPAQQSTGTFTATELAGDTTALPPIYEAAVLYSADYYDAASEVLKEYLRDPAGKNNLRAWLMLFDFYQLTHNRKEFDALSMLYTVKFERSPPVWMAADDAGDPRRKEKRERKDFFQIKPGIDGVLLAEIDRLEAFVKEMGSARVDFGKLKSILTAEAELLALVLQRIRKAKLPLWFNSLDDFAALLKKCINETGGEKSQGYWRLLFELCILDGRLHEYEELGLEYAVAFEMSPPAWETVTRPTGDTPEAGSPSAQGPATSGFQMKGVVSSSSKDTFAQLSTYAAARQEVVIDMGSVLRIDFTATSMFFEAVRGIHLAQKRVILSNLNELVAALLEVFAVNKHAILMRRKAS